MEEKRTQFAMQALGLAELFSMQFSGEKLVVGTKARPQGALQNAIATYSMEISAPEGPSTGGGKQAVQHIKLVPEQGSTIVIGSVNQVEQTAELRTFEYLARAYAQRYKGAAIPLDRDKYNDVMKRMQTFFLGSGFRLLTADAAQAPAAPESRRAPEANWGLRAGLIVMAVVLSLAVWFLFHKPPTT